VLLLVAAGLPIGTGLAVKGDRIPAAPQAVAALVASAMANETVPNAPQASEKTRFDRYDHNKDGRIDRDEYLLARHKNLMNLDTNGDGKLSFDEYTVKAIAKFGTADTDRSGVLDPTEFATTRVVRKIKPRCPPAQRPAPVASEGDN
jgi:hypothetical protein